jgi:proline iminopeptidase
VALPPTSKGYALPTINTNGVTITYQTDGDPTGVPLLLVMGLGMQLTSWPPGFIDGLVKRGYYLIRFDNRDSGLSSRMEQFGNPNLVLAFVKSLFRLPLKPGYTLNDMAQDAIGVLDALDVAQCHVVGASMGGMIAQVIAARHPQRVLTLTSIMSSSGRRSLPGPSASARRALLARPRNPQDREQIINQILHTFQVIGSPAFPTPVNELRQRIASGIERSPNNSGTARQMVAIVASGSRASLLKTIQARTLVIHGADDPLVPVACGRDTAHLIPGAALRIIKGMGHDLPKQLHPALIRMIDAHCKGETVPEA